MQCVQRCARCPGAGDTEAGPVLCDDPVGDCGKFNPGSAAHQFTLTPGPIKTTHQIQCRACGHIAPWVPLASNSITQCVLCGFVCIVKKLL